jgi:hypothetical protein
VSGTHLGPKTRFLLLSGSRGFVDVVCLLDERRDLSFTVAAGVKIKTIQDYNFACGSVWLRNLVSDIKRGTQTEIV